MKLRTLVIGLFFLGACSYQAQVVKLDPTLPALKTEQIAPGDRVLLLRTKDARSSTEIGRRDGDAKAAITTNQDIAELLKTKIGEILTAKGIQAEDTGLADSMPVLTVELTELSYQPFMDAKTSKVRIQAVLKILALKGPSRFERSFRATQERKTPFEPVAKSNEDWINETLSDVLAEFAKDEKTFSFLAS
jgi:uncharacterized lipoprotein YajG